MRLIKEDISYNDVQTLSEGTGANKKLYIKGPFLQAEKVNRNNRVYPQKIMDAAVARYMQEYIKENRALGELNHPPEPVVNPERAAIMTTSLEKDGCYYIGTAKVLSTPMGKIVENLINDGVKVGVSSRGLGSLKQAREGFNEVQEDFMLTTAADVVFDPSAQTAFVEGLWEGAEWVMESTGVFRKVSLDQMHDEIRRAKKANLMEAKLKMWKTFCDELVG